MARAQEVGPALAAAAPGLLHLKLENVSVTSHEPPDEEQPPLILDPSDSDDDEQPGLAADALAGGGVPPLLGEGSGSDDDLWPPALAAGPGDGGLPALAVDLPALVAASGSDSGSDDGGPPGLYYSDEDLLPDLHDSSDDDDGPPGLLGPPSDEDEDEWPPQRPLALLLWDRWQRLEALRLSNCNFRELAGAGV